MAKGYRNTIRAFLLFEVATFALAALIHVGHFVDGYEHFEAHVAETVIAIVLGIALLVSWFKPARTREAGLTGQGFALLGALVGLFTIAVGVGPRTTSDVVYHMAIIIVLVCGLLVARRARP